ncbi:MAG: AAA-like domain protein [Firmicutes bacterium ADurb.Bin419]|nr:MAG: AAA-like domain protein [Firmicutes bacterium ADurb.Bin419]
MRKINIFRDKLEFSGHFVKTFLITDYPQHAFVGCADALFHGEHKISGVDVSVSFYFKPSNLNFDFLTNYKLDRLQKNIEAYNDGKASSTPRKEEVDTLGALIHFRDTAGSNILDVWTTVTISSSNEKLFKKSVEKLEKLKYKGFAIHELNDEQHNALSVASVAGGDGRIFKRYDGRTLDFDAIAALYPFLDGSISDHDGAYMGHRLSTASIVHKNFTIGTDNQTMLVAGSSDSGKSTFIKGLIISLLIQGGFKLYAYDVDGELFKLCKKVGGEWVDYTTGGKFVDTTIIEPSILAEVKSHDADIIERATEADLGRWTEAVKNTEALFSLICDNFTVDKRNALKVALLDMWKDGGLKEEDPDTWDTANLGVIGLHHLYERIKFNGKNDDASMVLAKDAWDYFDGTNKNMFKNSQKADWLKNNHLTVFHVASSSDNLYSREGAIQIVSITSMVWQQIKRQRILKNGFSAEIYDEWQRLGRNPAALDPIFRSVTTGRKYNTQVIMATNNPVSLFNSDEGEGIWENSKYKILFSLEEKTIRRLCEYANIPDEVLQKWLYLHKYSFIYRERRGGTDLYDILKMELPDYEINTLSKTRGL